MAMTTLERAGSAAAVVLFSAGVGLLLRRILLPRLARWASTTRWSGDDLMVGSLRAYLPFWTTLAGGALALEFLAAPPRIADAIEKALLVSFLFSLALWCANTGTRLLELAAEAAGARPLTGVARYAVKLVVLGLGTLVILSTLGISVTPILTTFGIGGLAVALGLQDTLANLFAGMHITLARNVRVGDFVRLESGEEGFVEDIGWRAARVRTLPNNAVVIPNNRLAQSVLTNYDLPSQDIAVLVDVGVHYASDLPFVERVTCEVAREIMKTVAGSVPEFDPFIRFNRFGDSSIDFTVILRARSFGDNFLVKHEFIKALARRFANEGIVIPFPIRAVNLTQEAERTTGDRP
jgi:small-conductance mechanosensitive channel